MTFDYPHARMILEPYGGKAPPFEWDMSGLFLATEPPDYAKIRILAVNPETPAAAAGLRADDEIVSIDGKRPPQLAVDEARALFRLPVARRLQIRRDGKLLEVRLEAKRMV